MGSGVIRTGGGCAETSCTRATRLVEREEGRKTNIVTRTQQMKTPAKKAPSTAHRRCWPLKHSVRPADLRGRRGVPHDGSLPAVAAGSLGHFIRVADSETSHHRQSKALGVVHSQIMWFGKGGEEEEGNPDLPSNEVQRL
eukprot:Sspe_Gene.15695::Locus_5467_Transcript_1_1_Confidence_1.000_Length_1039::g.15695::m.15695